MKVNDEIDFKDGFNKGYWLCIYEPELAQSLIDSEIDITDDFSAGFSQGLLQAKQEKIISEFEQMRNKNKGQDKNIEK